MNAKDLAEYCESQGIGTIDPDTGDLFYSYLPDSPDNVICIYDTGGWNKDLNIPRSDSTFQIVFRAADYDSIQALIKKISDWFIPDGVPKECFSIGSYFIHKVQPMQSAPLPLGRDENGRDKFAWNFTFIIH